MLPEKYQWTAGIKDPAPKGMLTVLKKGADNNWSAPQVWQQSDKKALPSISSPTWLDKCLRSYSPNSIKNLVHNIKEAHRLRNTDGEVIVRGREFRNMYAGWDAGLEALGVNDYIRARKVVAKWPRIERYLLKRDYI